MILFISYLGLEEFYSLGLSPQRKVEKIAASVAGAGLVAMIVFIGIHIVLPVFVVLFFFFALFFLFRLQQIDRVASQLALICSGFIYISILLSHVGLLRHADSGREWVFFVLLVIMACDSCAYFSGMALGRHKLYPAVSPKKSIEGAVGGLCGSVVAAFLAKIWFFSALTSFDCVLLGLFLSVAGQLGDLFESLLKRSFDVKDSGSLFPGHGGILDRLDSLLFAFPLAYYYAQFVFTG